MGFKTSFQAAEVLFINRQILEKGREWLNSLKPLIFDGDIYKAYDRVRHSAVKESALSRGVPEEIIDAYLRENRRTSKRYRMNLRDANPFISQRGLLQG